MLHQMQRRQANGVAPGFSERDGGGATQQLATAAGESLRFDTNAITFDTGSPLPGVPRVLNDPPDTIFSAEESFPINNHDIGDEPREGVHELIIGAFPGIDASRVDDMVKASSSYHLAIARPMGSSLRIYSTSPSAVWLCTSDEGWLCHGSVDVKAKKDKEMKACGQMTQTRVDKMMQWNPFSSTGLVKRADQSMPATRLDMTVSHNEKIDALRCVTRQACDMLADEFDLGSDLSSASTTLTPASSKAAPTDDDSERRAKHQDWGPVEEQVRVVTGKQVGLAPKDTAARGRLNVIERHCDMADEELSSFLHAVRRTVGPGFIRKTSSNPGATGANRDLPVAAASQTPASAPNTHRGLVSLSLSAANDIGAAGNDGPSPGPEAGQLVNASATGDTMGVASQGTTPVSDNILVGGPAKNELPSREDKSERELVRHAHELMVGHMEDTLARSAAMVVGSDPGCLELDNLDTTAKLVAEQSTEQLNGMNFQQLLEAFNASRRALKKEKKEKRSKEGEPSKSDKERKERKGKASKTSSAEHGKTTDLAPKHGPCVPGSSTDGNPRSHSDPARQRERPAKKGKKTRVTKTDALSDDRELPPVREGQEGERVDSQGSQVVPPIEDVFNAEGTRSTLAERIAEAEAALDDERVIIESLPYAAISRATLRTAYSDYQAVRKRAKYSTKFDFLPFLHTTSAVPDNRVYARPIKLLKSTVSEAVHQYVSGFDGHDEAAMSLGVVVLTDKAPDENFSHDFQHTHDFCQTFAQLSAWFRFGPIGKETGKAMFKSENLRDWQRGGIMMHTRTHMPPLSVLVRDSSQTIMEPMMVGSAGVSVGIVATHVNGVYRGDDCVQMTTRSVLAGLRQNNVKNVIVTYAGRTRNSHATNSLDAAIAIMKADNWSSAFLQTAVATPDRWCITCQENDTEVVLHEGPFLPPRIEAGLVSSIGQVYASAALGRGRVVAQR